MLPILLLLPSLLEPKENPDLVTLRAWDALEESMDLDEPAASRDVVPPLLWAQDMDLLLQMLIRWLNKPSGQEV